MKDLLGLDRPITRRDFVNGVLCAGASAMVGCATRSDDAHLDLAPSGSAWTGYGGVGDYRWSNGNTERVRDAAHGIRDGRFDEALRAAPDESYDVIVVGGGFSGMTAAYEFHKRAAAHARLLLLENHPIVGGEAKLNELDVDGRRLVGPQGSNAALIPRADWTGTRAETYANCYRELDLPLHFDLERIHPALESLRMPNDHYMPMVEEHAHPAGYFFRGTGWVKDPRANGFANTPWPQAVQRELDDFVRNRRDVVSRRENVDRWLDAMTYRDLLDRLGYGPTVSQYVDPYMAVADFGVCGDAVSAYAAKRLGLPGTMPSDTPDAFDGLPTVSFPGGNSAILRAMLRRMLPDSIAGPDGWQGTATGHVRFEALDRRDSRVRLRPSATVVRVEHDGEPRAADSVLVSYVVGDRLRRARARAVVMATGGWVNRRVVRDLPTAHAVAYSHFNYGPVLVANVAVRHWRFFEKLGISVARWFEGLGWHVVARRNVALRADAPPLTPDDPMMLTFYIPFLFPGRPAAEQGALGRQQLLGTLYADFELRIREQMNELFGGTGFDARRDIAGIVLNRWGHAFVAPPPGFFFGKEGGPPLPDVIRRPHGRVVFGHSELQGLMNMAFAMHEGRRAGLEALAIAAA